MSSFVPNVLGKEARIRKQLRQITVLSKEFCSNSTLSRIENNRQMPTQGVLEKLMREVGIPLDEFFCPYLVNQSIEILVLCDQLIYHLDNKGDKDSVAEAKRLFNIIENREGFKKGINLQFLLSCKARIREMDNADPSEVVAIIYEGMAITFAEFNEDSFSGEMLIFEEIKLLHTLAVTYRRRGESDKAVKLLEGILTGIEILPEDDNEKRKKLTAILFTLSDLLIERKEYEKALLVSERGFESSLKYVKGKFAAAFTFNKAVCLYNLGRRDKCAHFFKLAYFSHILFHNKKKAEMVKADAEELCGVTINTYGMEALDLYPQPFIPQSYGKSPNGCKTIGQLIFALRAQANLTRKKVCAGIFNETTLLRMEKGGKSKKNKGKQYGTNVYGLEAVMQRLGRDINLYFHTFISVQKFEEKQIRDEINALLALLKFDEAEERLNKLETSGEYQTGVNLQFIKISKAKIVGAKEEYGDKFINMVNEALLITIPDFNIDDITQYPLTYNEILLVNMLAVYYNNNKNIPQAIKILEQLRDSMNKSYVDESEKIRTYPMILYNYSKYLGLMKRYDESLAVVNEGEVFMLKHNHLLALPSLILNKGYVLHQLGKLDKAIPYLAAAYYGFALIGDDEDKNVTGKYVMEHMGVLID